MNYRHSYHAGSFTDVVKHIILTTLITALSRKENAFCYIDTHAGSGCYDLDSEFAAKTKEYKNGIEKIIQQENPPRPVKHYLDCVHKINNHLVGSTFASLRYYPGSPLLVRSLARAHDRIIACELQSKEYQILKTTFAGDKQVAVHHMDGLLGLKAFLPPPERRGIVFIDPPYEDQDEFTRIAHSLATAIKRWKTGIFAIWYPIKARSQVERFYRSIKENISNPIYAIELTIYPDLPQHLNGCGLTIVNPPWQFDESMNAIIPWLWKVLTINHQGAYRTFMLK
jgi:23S rRNA (adenine2030-N6)-methyltransferase